MDDERLKGNRGGNYWKELLDCIRDIRSSEKVLYRQVLDLYATSVDYDSRSDESIRFLRSYLSSLQGLSASQPITILSSTHTGEPAIKLLQRQKRMSINHIKNISEKAVPA